MKALLAIFLMLLLLFPSVFHLFVFKIQQYQIRTEIKQQIKTGVAEEDLVVLKIPLFLEQNPNKLFKRIEPHEFRYQGEMYDIMRQELHGDTTYYFCIWDEKESELFENLDEKVAQHMSQNPEHKKQQEILSRLLGSLYLMENNYPKYTDLICPAPDSAYYSFILKNWIKIPPTPPPIVLQ